MKHIFHHCDGRTLKTACGLNTTAAIATTTDPKRVTCRRCLNTYALAVPMLTGATPPPYNNALILDRLRYYLAFPTHNRNCMLRHKTWATQPEHCDCGLFVLLKLLREQGVEIPNHVGKTPEEIFDASA